MGVKVGEGGKLYGSITSKDIADALARRGIEVDRHKIDLEEPLKSLGTYKVAIKVFTGHDARGHDRRRAEGLTAGRSAAAVHGASRQTLTPSRRRRSRNGRLDAKSVGSRRRSRARPPLESTYVAP